MAEKAAWLSEQETKRGNSGFFNTAATMRGVRFSETSGPRNEPKPKTQSVGRLHNLMVAVWLSKVPKRPKPGLGVGFRIASVFAPQP